MNLSPVGPQVPPLMHANSKTGGVGALYDDHSAAARDLAFRSLRVILAVLGILGSSLAPRFGVRHTGVSLPLPMPGLVLPLVLRRGRLNVVVVAVDGLLGIPMLSTPTPTAY